MLENFRNKTPLPVDTEIDVVLKKMHEMGVDHPDYPTMMTYLDRLHDIQAKERRPRVSRDTMFIVLGNLLGILVIVVYEQKHVITSKGWGRDIRPK